MVFMQEIPKIKDGSYVINLDRNSLDRFVS